MSLWHTDDCVFIMFEVPDDEDAPEGTSLRIYESDENSLKWNISIVSGGRQIGGIVNVDVPCAELLDAMYRVASIAWYSEELGE